MSSFPHNSAVLIPGTDGAKPVPLSAMTASKAGRRRDSKNRVRVKIQCWVNLMIKFYVLWGVKRTLIDFDQWISWPTGVSASPQEMRPSLDCHDMYIAMACLCDFLYWQIRSYWRTQVRLQTYWSFPRLGQTRALLHPYGRCCSDLNDPAPSGPYS